MRSRRAKRRGGARISTLEQGAQPYYVNRTSARYENRRGRRGGRSDLAGQLDPDRTPLPGKWNSLFHFWQPNQYDPGSKPIGAEKRGSP